MIVVVVIDQGCKNAQTVLTSLIDRPVHRSESSIVEHTQGWFEGQRIPYTHAKGLRAYGVSSHRHESVHNFSDPTLSRVGCVERRIEWLSCWRNHVFVQSKPVHIGSRCSPSFAAQLELSTRTDNIAIPYELCLFDRVSGNQLQSCGSHPPQQARRSHEVSDS